MVLFSVLQNLPMRFWGYTNYALLLPLSIAMTPFAHQVSCFAGDLHIVQGITQPQALQYRFGRNLPHFSIQALHILKCALPVF